MRLLLLAALAAGAAHTSVIQGIAIENASSAPLARTRIKLQRVGGSSGLTAVGNLIAGRMGQFVFTGLSEGLYVVSAVRPAYADTVYVAKPGDSRSSLVQVGKDSNYFAEVRVKRLGVVSGRIVDENRIGIPGVNVLAYTASIPLRVAAQGKTDDRGVYRVFGLPKGKYYVRNAPLQLDDGPGLLPTFYPHGTMAKDAGTVNVDLDRETTEVDIMPMHGTLFTISGGVMCNTGTATVVLSSDTGRKQMTVPCGGKFSFPELAPAQFELLGYEPVQKVASWVAFSADRDRDLGLQLREYPDLTNGTRGQVMIRRRDLAGEHEVSPLPAGRYVSILPGMWDMTAVAPAGKYIDTLYVSPEWSRQTRPAGDWYEFQARDASNLGIGMRLGERTASLAGVVKQRGDVAPGVPVFLYPVLPETRVRNAGNRLGFSDENGRFRFDGLPPGRYLVAASFEISTPTEDTMRAARADEVTLAEGATEERTLPVDTSQ
jgi:hypothetical protein